MKKIFRIQRLWFMHNAMRFCSRIEDAKLIYIVLSEGQGSEQSEYRHLQVKQLNPKIQVLLLL